MTIPAIFDFIFPPACHICGAPLASGERFICASCVTDLPRTGYHSNPANRMTQRFAGIFPFERATAHFFYSRDSMLAQLIHDFKYRHFPGLAERLGEIMGTELLRSGFLHDIDMVVPIPMHLMKRARRGYNQTERLAAGITRATDIPTCTLLKAVRPHTTQTSKTLAQRRENVSDVFRLDNPSELVGRHVLLLDDVCTTGATLTAAAETILRTTAAAAPGHDTSTSRGYDPANPPLRISMLTLGATF